MTKKFLNNIDLNGTLTIAGSGGTNGYFLSTNGAGVISWAAAGAGSLGYIGNYQTTAASVITGNVTIGGNTGASINPFSLSLLGGNTTSASTTGGSIVIRGGNSSNNATITTGGSITIAAGNGGTTQGAGGGVSIDGGTGSAANGNGSVSIGTNSGTDVVFLGKSAGNVYLNAGTTNITGSLSFDGSSNALTSVNAPGVLRVDSSSLQINFNNLATYNASGAFGYSGNTFYGYQTSTGAGRIPAIHSVFSLANSTASTNTTQSVFATANDVLSSLEAVKLYIFKAKYYSSFTYSATAGAINIVFGFSNAPQSIKYSFKTYPQTAGTTITQQGVSSVATATTIVPSQSAAGTWVTEIEGYFISHATLTSTLTPQFICTAATSSSAVMQAGSWFEVEKIGTSTSTSIAGNWA
jgi:hypothetical protein